MANGRVVVSSRVDLDVLAAAGDAVADAGRLVDRVTDEPDADSVAGFVYTDDLRVAYQVRDVLLAAADGRLALEDVFAVGADRWTCLGTLESGPLEYGVIREFMRTPVLSTTRADMQAIVADPPTESTVPLT